MKKNLSKKLLLNKKTVATLDINAMRDAKGGILSWVGVSCFQTSCNMEPCTRVYYYCSPAESIRYICPYTAEPCSE